MNWDGRKKIRVSPEILRLPWVKYKGQKPVVLSAESVCEQRTNSAKTPFISDNRTKLANLTLSVHVARKTAVELLVAAKVQSPHESTAFRVSTMSYCVPRMRCRQIGAGKSRLQKMIVAPSSPARPRPQRIAFKAIGPNAAKLPLAS